MVVWFEAADWEWRVSLVEEIFRGSLGELVCIRYEPEKRRDLCATWLRNVGWARERLICLEGRLLR